MASQQDREEGNKDVNNRQTSRSRLAFITATELPKLKEHRTSSDDICTKGPEIGEFCDHFRAYLARPNITNNNDKITALRMNIHASQGNAKHTLSIILDDNINYEMINLNT